MYPASTVIALWNNGTLSRAELISYLGIRPNEPLDVLEDPVLQEEIEKFRQSGCGWRAFDFDSKSL